MVNGVAGGSHLAERGVGQMIFEPIRGNTGHSVARRRRIADCPLPGAGHILCGICRQERAGDQKYRKRRARLANPFIAVVLLRSFMATSGKKTVQPEKRRVIRPLPITSADPAGLLQAAGRGKNWLVVSVGNALRGVPGAVTDFNDHSNARNATKGVPYSNQMDCVARLYVLTRRAKPKYSPAGTPLPCPAPPPRFVRRWMPRLSINAPARRIKSVGRSIWAVWPVFIQRAAVACIATTRRASPRAGQSSSTICSVARSTQTRCFTPRGSPAFT